MRAIDTNVLARFLLNDDPGQCAAARRIVAEGAFVPSTVILELEWLLRSRYGFPRDAIAEMLTGIVDLPTIVVSDLAGIAWAIDRYARRGDLADMFHLIGSGPSDRFCTFDKGIAKTAGPRAPVVVETLA